MKILRTLLLLLAFLSQPCLAATTEKPLYGSATAITCTTTSLASDTNLLAGRASASIDNTTNLYTTAYVGGTIVTTGTPAATTEIDVYFYGSWDNATTYSDAIGGTDANVTIATGQKNILSLATVIAQTGGATVTYTIGPIDVAAAMGLLTLPDHWGVFIVHNTANTLGATTLKYTGVNRQSL
jgi:hypothetical protein